MITVHPTWAVAPVEYNDNAHIVLTLPNGGQIQIGIDGDEIEVMSLRSLTHEMLIKPTSGNVVRLRVVRDLA